MSSNNSAAQINPTRGDINNAKPVSLALTQFTPSPNSCPADSIELASPTPMMDPTSACELDAGRPRYHVPRFQMIAEINNAKTMANPAPDPTLSTSSTGSNARTAKATPPPDCSTPMRFQQPDHTTAMLGFREWV